MNLEQAITAAYAADETFEATIKAAGYKSRWDWLSCEDSRPLASYQAKVEADLIMHREFERHRS